MEMTQEKEREIIRLLKEDGEAGMKALFDTYYMPLCIYSMQMTDALEASEDLVQEIFISFWEKEAYLRIDVSLKTWLFNAARNASLAYMKRQRPFSLQEMEETLADEEEDFSEEELQERKRKLDDAMLKLSPQENRVLRAVVIENKRYKDVADELGISVNSIKTYLSRALKFLRSQSLLSVLLHLYC